MANCIFGTPIYSDDGVLQTPVLSGGAWQAGLPLTNLKDRYLANVARSVDAALTSTIVKADLGVARNVRVLAGVKHNLTTSAKQRWRLFAATPILETNDFNGGVTVGTPIVTTGQTDPFGGTRATKIEDDDGAVQEAKGVTPNFTGDGTKSAALSIKAGTSPVTNTGIFDQSASAWRHFVKVAWAGGVPTLTTEQGSGTLYTPVALNDDWWLIQFTAANVVAANTNRFYCYPSDLAAQTGTGFCYEAMAFDYDGQPIVADSGVIDAWPSGLDLEEADGLPVKFQYILPSDVSARYARLELADTANLDGYVELGRLIVAGGYQPTFNPDYGAQIRLRTATTRSESDDAAAIFDVRPIRRIAAGVLSDIPENEAFTKALRMQRLLGKHGQLFFVFNPEDDPEMMTERSFLGVFEDVSGLEFPYFAVNSMSFAVLEEL